MKILGPIRSLAGKFFHRDELAADMDEELQAHIALRADDLVRNGLSRPQAERRARIEFGARERHKEDSFAALGGNFVDTMLRDLRFALRVLRKSPGFTFAAVVTLALAIGANAVVFGVMDALVLHTLDVPDGRSLYGTEYSVDAMFQPYPNFRDLRKRNRSFTDLAAFNFELNTALDTGNDPVGANGFATTGNYFGVLGLQPLLGRFYSEADEHGPGSAPYLVLSYGYWHRRFHDDRGVIGRKILVNKHPFTIVGVGPRGFGGTLMFTSVDFFMPLVNAEQIGGESLTSRTIGTTFESFGHLKPGVTPQQAEADVNRVAAELVRAYPREIEPKHVVLGRTGLTSLGGPVQAFVGALMALAGLILLAACANLGSLFAAHAADRSKEVALRLALGSSRTRVLRQLLTEAVLIGLGGGVVGLLGSMPLLERLSTWHPFPGAPIHIPVTMDARIYAVALALAVFSGLLFGIVPVRQVMRANAYEIVKTGAAVAAGGAGRRVTLRDVLLAVQIAICAVLVTASLVAVRGLMRSVHANFGFDPRNTMTSVVNLATAGYGGEQIPRFNRRMIDAMASIPGVEAVGQVNGYPPLVYTAAWREKVFTEQTHDLKPANVAITPFRFNVSPGYLAAAGTVLLAGHDFTWSDDKSALLPALANRRFAQTMFGSVSGALGRHFRIHDGTLAEIVGVVEDGKYLALTEDQQPAVFLPSMLYRDPQSYTIVRSKRDPQQLAAAMRTKTRELDAGLPVGIQSWTELLEVVQFPAKVATMALGVLGALGAMLSITGIFGMAAYAVSQRLKELGIRMALGAKRTEVLKAALGRAVKLLAFGSAAGLLLGILASRVLSYIVYQATPRDPLVLAGVVLAMALLGLLATWIPAQRALAVDPMALLRED
ncbi:MAG TPA: ADOP family duplicated permease [Terracidiphilus sp.]|jgi:predicted permease|nr:ADOP family duplicated permease [Terracidiphilus sp.]